MTNRSPHGLSGGTPDGGFVTVAVDRRENEVLVLVSDTGETFEIEAASLPEDCRHEGAVLRVPLGPRSNPVWAGAKRDSLEEKRRLSLLTDRLEKLRRTDPGGDVSL
jgi:hypothetical protein